MYVRIVSVKLTPDKLEQGIAAFQQQVVPTARQQAGYVGAAQVLNRETGEASGATYWDSLESLNASEQQTTRRRAEVAGGIGAAVMDVERFEVAIFERAAGAGEPRSGAFARVNELYAQPAKVDGLIAFMRDNAPSVLQQQGCRALVMGVNRMTGRSFVTSVWETAADREASEAAVTGMRKEAGEVAGGQATVTLGEVAFVELTQAARTG
jgi:quinol monooxygenase YgiN/heme-degrading monooxygenase HmoA